MTSAPTLKPGWKCPCRTSEKWYSFTKSTCPRCGKPMPDYIRQEVYREVLAELRRERLSRHNAVWAREAARCSRRKIPLRITMGIAAVAFIVLLAIFRRPLFPIPSVEQLPTALRALLDKGTELVTTLRWLVEKPIASLAQSAWEIVTALWELVCTAFQWVRLLFSRLAELIHFIRSLFH